MCNVRISPLCHLRVWLTLTPSCGVSLLIRSTSQLGDALFHPQSGSLLREPTPVWGSGEVQAASPPCQSPEAGVTVNHVQCFTDFVVTNEVMTTQEMFLHSVARLHHHSCHQSANMLSHSQPSLMVHVLLVWTSLCVCVDASTVTATTVILQLVQYYY